MWKLAFNLESKYPSFTPDYTLLLDFDFWIENEVGDKIARGGVVRESCVFYFMSRDISLFYQLFPIYVARKRVVDYDVHCQNGLPTAGQGGDNNHFAGVKTIREPVQVNQPG